MSIQKIAQRYATALTDVVMEKDLQSVVREELKWLSQLMQQSGELREVFANPAITAQQKENVLDRLLDRTQPSDLTKNLLRLLQRNERLHHLDEVYSAFLKELDDRLSIITAHVSSARPLNGEEARQLQRGLEEMTGKQIRTRMETNPDLIGGLVVRIGSEIYDGSIQTQLEHIRQQLSQ